MEAELRAHLARDGELPDHRELALEPVAVQDADDERHRLADQRRRLRARHPAQRRVDDRPGQTDGDPEATGVPSDSTTTPDKAKFPTGTDATYVALVDTFAQSPFVLFGLTNEPGGNKRTNAELAAAMSHAVGTIRAEEDKLGVPHHIVSVQGNGWTSDICFYATTPLAYDNVVYEVHGYPPATSSYTYANIPVIIGEYGSLSSSDAFYADLEAKQIPNLAWDFEPYSDCAPDLLNVTTDATKLTPSAWGQTVQKYLLSH